MNSLIIESVEATNGQISFMRVPVDDPNKTNQQWMGMRWHYVGQNMGGQTEDGVCGSALWNEDSNVVGF